MEQGTPQSAAHLPLVDFDAVCEQVRTAIEPARTHAVSLHDELGEILWLSESSMGPDEHNAMRSALEVFAEPDGAPVLSVELGDSRSAVSLRAIDSRRAFVGAVMIVLDTRVIKQDARGAVRLLTPKMQRALAEFAGMRSDAVPAPAPRAPAPAPAPAPAATATPAPATAVDPIAAPSPAPAESSFTASNTIPVLKSTQVSPEIDRLNAALRKMPIALHVQHLVPLTKGSQMRRYEVLLRSKSEDAPNVAPQAMLKAAVEHGLGSMIDRRVLTELIGWLVHHPDVWQSNAVMFSVNLTSTALHDEHFMKFVGLCLAKSSLPKAMIAFEVDVPTAVKLGPKFLEVADALVRLDCPIVLDDFGLRTECFDLLRVPGVRYVKLDPEITAKLRSDKLSQAAITAVVQMARVLGMHVVAKRTESAAEQEWLTALGVDFIQSNALGPPVAIDTLSRGQKPKH